MFKSQDALVDTLEGLDDNQVEKSRQKHGDNQLGRRKKKTFLKQFFENFNDPIIKILLIVLAINLLFLLKNFQWYESAGIAIAIFLATFVSTLSEYGSEAAFEQLQQEAQKTKARVKRSRGVMEISVNDIVVGDYVILQAGEKIPADGIIISGKLSVDQSALNGESKETLKIPSDSGQTGVNVNDFMSKNRLFRGSIVSSGEGIMLVTAVGNATFYGNIAHEIQEETRDSPLKIRLRKLAETISRFSYVAAAVVAGADLFNSLVMDQAFNTARILAVINNVPVLIGHLIHAITLAITVIVVAVPEGLPMMITVVLSSNMQRMLKDNILVRKLVGIETSGSMNILFADKTGTITKGKLELVSVLDGESREYGGLSSLYKNQRLYELFEISAMYNTSCAVSRSAKTPYAVGGNTTERAIMDAFLKNRALFKNVQVISRLPFDSIIKFSAVRVIDHEKQLTLIKGAPEKILSKCTYYYDQNGEKQPFSDGTLLKKMSEMSSKAIRLLAVAASEDKVEHDGDLKNLTFIGIIGLKDEIRREARGAIQQVTKAGVQVVMITGDNKETAAAIAYDVGLTTPGQRGAVITSGELNALSDEQLKEAMPNIRVVARALPSDKSRLVKISQAMGLVAGMTGDGVNDAPALKRADVGFSMGSGTEIAKEASDIVILDDNFLSISKAILYGRTIFKSIRKFIIFQLTVNLCAVVVSIVGPFIGIDTPVTVLQMLWINMVMDTLAGIAFSGETPLEEYMKEPPKRRNEPIINSYMWNQIFFTGVYTSLLCLAFLKLPIFAHFFRQSDSRIYLMSAFFCLFMFASIFNSFNARTYRINLLAHIFKNKLFIIVISFVAVVQILLIYFGGSLFRTAGLTLFELQTVLILSFSVIPVDIARKIYLRRHGKKGNI